MKKIVLLLIVLVGIISTSCKSSKGHCDAYGNKISNAEDVEFDIYDTHHNSTSKYVNTTSIK